MQKEIPYSKIDPRELDDLEAEFGRTLTPELAQILIRCRINRNAIELMLRKGSSESTSATGSSGIEPPKPAPSSLASSGKDTKREDEEEALKSARQPGARRAARKAVA